MEKPGRFQEACEIARHWGVEIPSYVQFWIDEYDYLDEYTTAKTTTFREFEGTIIDWSWFFHKTTGKIPFLIRKDIMASDEAIVAVIGHEMFETRDASVDLRRGRACREMGGQDQPEQPRELPLASVGICRSIGCADEGGGRMIKRLIEIYESGAITGYQVMIDCLQMLDPDNPDLVLSDLPEEILDEMLKDAQRYRPSRPRSASLILPSEDQVRTAERWICTRRTRSSKPVNL